MDTVGKKNLHQQLKEEESPCYNQADSRHVREERNGVSRREPEG